MFVLEKDNGASLEEARQQAIKASWEKVIKEMWSVNMLPKQ